MVYTVTQLISNAWNLSGIVAAQAETVSGEQLKEGLDHLNDFLALQSTESRMIPYTRIYFFECQAKQDEFLIEHLLQIDVLTLSEKDMVYTLQSLRRKDFFTQPCQHYSPARPQAYHSEPDKGGSRLFLSPTPSKNYRLRLVGKFGLSEVNYNDDLNAIYGREYILYLRYGLADYLCDLYNHPFAAKTKLSLLEAKLRNYSSLDLGMNKVCYFNTGSF
jgi:hypothetical protein